MKSTINQRIIEVLKFYSVSENSLASSTGISQTTINSALKSNKDNVSTKIVVGIIQTFPELNLRWLLTGEGEMLVSGDTSSADQHAARELEERLAAAERGHEELRRKVEAMERSMETMERSMETMSRLVAIIERMTPEAAPQCATMPGLTDICKKLTTPEMK